MPTESIVILLSPHAMQRLRQRAPQGHGIAKRSFIRLMLVRAANETREDVWVLRAPNAFLLGKVWKSAAGKHTFLVRTVFDIGRVRRRQRQTHKQFIPLAARLFFVTSITGLSPTSGARMVNPRSRAFAYSVDENERAVTVRPSLASLIDFLRGRFERPDAKITITAWFSDGNAQRIAKESLLTGDSSAWITTAEAKQIERTMFPPPTVREQMLSVLRRNEDADYWERLVLRFADGLLAIVDENLRGIPAEQAGLDSMQIDDWNNLPDTIELVGGIPKPKHWMLYAEGRRRLGFASISDENQTMRGKSTEEVDAEYERLREELRKRPFVPSPVPFPGGEPEP